MAIKDRDPDNNPNTPPPSLGLLEIASEFGDTGSHSLSEFYRGGAKVPDSTTSEGTGVYTDEIINIPGSAGSDPNVNFWCRNCLVNGFVVQAVTPYMLMNWGSMQFVWTAYAGSDEIAHSDGYTYALGSERTVTFLNYNVGGDYNITIEEFTIQAYAIKRKPTSTSTTTAINTGIPKSGSISFSDMYSSANGGVTYTTIIDEDGNPVLVPITEDPPDLGQRAPNEPTGLAITASDGQLSVAFVAPSDVGSASGLSGYQYSVDDGANYVATTQLVSPIVIAGLTNGTTYTVRLRALNIYVEGGVTYNGIGTASNAITGTPPVADIVVPPPVVTLVAPAAPTNLVVTAGDGKASIAFTAPTSGTATIPAITNYEYFFAYYIEVYIGGEGGVGVDVANILLESGWLPLNPADAASPIDIPNLINGSLYEFRIRAVNSVGAGASSAKVGGTPKPGEIAIAEIVKTVTVPRVDQIANAGVIDRCFHDLPNTIYQTHAQDYEDGGVLTWALSGSNTLSSGFFQRNIAPRVLFDVPFTNNWITIPEVIVQIRGFDGGTSPDGDSVPWYQSFGYDNLVTTVRNPAIHIYGPDGSELGKSEVAIQATGSDYVQGTIPSIVLNTSVKGIYTVSLSLDSNAARPGGPTLLAIAKDNDYKDDGGILHWYRRDNWVTPAFDISLQNTDPS